MLCSLEDIGKSAAEFYVKLRAQNQNL